MVARADIEAYRTATGKLSALARTAVQSFVGSLDLTDPEASRDALLRFVPEVTDRFGRVSASLSAEWYEETRLASGAKGSFRATAAKPVPREAVISQARFLAGHLWTPAPLNVLGGLLTSVDKYVKQPARDTMAGNARRENVRWARVPSGAKTCSFCLVLASRDAVYLSKKAAGGDGNKYHGKCDCVAVRIASAKDYPADYLPDNYYDMYSTARDEAGSGNLKDITAAFRRTFPDAVTDGVPTP